MIYLCTCHFLYTTHYYTEENMLYMLSDNNDVKEIVIMLNDNNYEWYDSNKSPCDFVIPINIIIKPYDMRLINFIEKYILDKI